MNIPGALESGTRFILFVDAINGNLPVFVGVWYAVDPDTITSSRLPAEYPLNPYK